MIPFESKAHQSFDSSDIIPFAIIAAEIKKTHEHAQQIVIRVEIASAELDFEQIPPARPRARPRPYIFTLNISISLPACDNNAANYISQQPRRFRHDNSSPSFSMLAWESVLHAIISGRSGLVVKRRVACGIKFHPIIKLPFRSPLLSSQQHPLILVAITRSSCCCCWWKCVCTHVHRKKAATWPIKHYPNQISRANT